MSKSLKITFDLDIASYRSKLGTLHIQSAEMTVREVEMGLRDLITSIELELMNLAKCPYHNKGTP
jgi:hypothetical protein